MSESCSGGAREVELRKYFINSNCCFCVTDAHILYVLGPLVTLNKPPGLPVTGMVRGRGGSGIGLMALRDWIMKRRRWWHEAKGL